MAGVIRGSFALVAETIPVDLFKAKYNDIEIRFANRIEG